MKIEECGAFFIGDLINKIISLIGGYRRVVGIKKNIQVFFPGFQIAESTVSIIGSLSQYIFFRIEPAEELVDLFCLGIKHRLIAVEGTERTTLAKYSRR
jgi:hypothetical protein